MKIVVTGTRGIPDIMGGVETHVEELYPRLSSMGFDITVIRRKNYTKDNLTSWKGVKLIDIDTPRKKSFEAIIHTFKAILVAKKLKADIVHIHAIGPALLVPLIRLLGMKAVFTHHGPDYDRDKWGKLAKIMLRLGERFGVMFSNDIIVISSTIQSLLENKYKRHDYHLIYNGVPKANLCSFPEYFESLGITPQNYIFTMCRFVPEKNLHHLIKAFALTNPKGHKLVIAGGTDFEDGYYHSLIDLAKKNNVILTGFIKGEKLHSLLTNAKCFVLPSSHEGLPIALLEAMSYNIPVIVSNIAANLEVGLPEEQYFTTGNIQELAAKLQKIIDNPFIKTEYNMEKYNWDNIARQVSEIYQKYNNK